jgi:hypothetical protein
MIPVIWKARAIKRTVLMLKDGFMAAACEAGATFRDELRDEFDPKRVLSLLRVHDVDMT